MALFPPSLRQILFGNPFGEVFPPKPNPPPLSIDGRTIALRLLRDYITNLTFFRPMGQAPVQAFQIDAKNFHIEWPDYIEDMKFPSVAIVHSRARYDVIGLVSYVEETTRNVYAKDTVLQWQSEYVEKIQLEIWTNKKAERRAILAGIETAMSPTEQMSGLRFQMKDYFNELVCFTLFDREIIDEPDSPKNRRRAQLGIEMRFNIVALVNAISMTPALITNTDYNESTGLAIQDAELDFVIPT